MPGRPCWLGTRARRLACPPLCGARICWVRGLAEAERGMADHGLLLVVAAAFAAAWCSWAPRPAPAPVAER
eukprot:3203767-Alexandrium_andersonii.AAC.1